jgi:hypothetical protein
MPIQLNLLAEQQRVELERRRDPVRRTLIGGIAAAGLMLAWYAALQGYAATLNSSLDRNKAALSDVESKSQSVIASLRRSAEVDNRLKALQSLATNRFLWGNTLHALQHSMVPGIEVSRISARQAFQIDPPAEKKDDNAPKKPRYSTEQLTLSIEARDYAPAAELNHTRLMGKLGSSDYFQPLLDAKEGVALRERGREQPDSIAPDRMFIQFRVDCLFIEKKRTL